MSVCGSFTSCALAICAMSYLINLIIKNFQLSIELSHFSHPDLKQMSSNFQIYLSIYRNCQVTKLKLWQSKPFASPTFIFLFSPRSVHKAGSIFRCARIKTEEKLLHVGDRCCPVCLSVWVDGLSRARAWECVIDAARGGHRLGCGPSAFHPWAGNISQGKYCSSISLYILASRQMTWEPKTGCDGSCTDGACGGEGENLRVHLYIYLLVYLNKAVKIITEHFCA